MEDEKLNAFIKTKEKSFYNFCDKIEQDYDSTEAKVEFILQEEIKTEYKEFMQFDKYPSHIYKQCSSCGDLTSKTHEFLVTKNKGEDTEYSIYYCSKCKCKTEISNK